MKHLLCLLLLFAFALCSWGQDVVVVDFTPAGGTPQDLNPDGVVYTITSMTGAVATVQDDPDSPDASWLVGDCGNCVNTDGQMSFATPTDAPTTGAGLQTFRVWALRKNNSAGQPTLTIHLYENGTDLANNGGVSVSSTTGEMHTFTWNASLLTNADGSGVEIFVNCPHSGGAPGGRNNCDYDAVEWNEQ